MGDKKGERRKKKGGTKREAEGESMCVPVCLNRLEACQRSATSIQKLLRSGHMGWIRENAEKPGALAQYTSSNWGEGGGDG